MHHGPMKDSDGKFDDEWMMTANQCSKCDGTNVWMRVWESSCGGYEDHQYHCRDCDHKWWVDGPDA